MPCPSLIDCFAALEDPRQSWKTRLESIAATGKAPMKGVRIGGEGRGPLRGVLFIPPAERMGLDIAGAGVFKSHRVRRLEHPRMPFSAPLLDWIEALDTRHAQDLSRPARVGKRDNVGAAQACIARAIGGAIPTEP